MKTMIRLLTCAVVAAISTEAARAALNIPSDGSDGALVITNNTVIDLSQAVTGNWDANNSANAGKGVYDPAKWAVVFKYSSVTIDSGATVTFKNHASRAPVVWLVSGDVTVNGTVSLDGQQALLPPLLAEPGPGGFRGGAGNYGPGVTEAAGFGPGGGGIKVGQASGYYGAGGSYGSVGTLGRSTYGNPSLIPLVGGSGGGGRNYADNDNRRGGGGGGGALLIASGGTLAVAGTIRANGGSGQIYNDPSIWNDAAGGSGGGIRLVCEAFVGSGNVRCLGGNGALGGGLGRIRLERTTTSTTTNFVVAPDPSLVTLPSGATPQIWMPTNGPAVRIISIGGNPAPADPRAGFGAIGADTILPRVTNTTVVVETTNVEQASVVTVRATPRSNGNFTETTAAVTQVVSEDPLVVRWTANVPVNDGYSAIQIKVVRP